MGLEGLSGGTGRWRFVSSLSVWKIFSYQSLPQQPLKLSVLKLDGSCFELLVERTATVAELKEAVEEVFSRSTDDHGEIQISWTHVWTHFCLCYEGQKLVDDKAYIRLYGIKDEDQIYFVRHLSINYGQEEGS